MKECTAWQECHSTETIITIGHRTWKREGVLQEMHIMEANSMIF